MDRHQHHQRNRDRDRRALAITLAITATYCLVELVGGILTNSLALLSDAGHMFADVGSARHQSVRRALEPATTHG